MNPHPVPFPVELQQRITADRSSRQTRKLLTESLQEENSNPIMVGSRVDDTERRLFQPHNYRLYIDFDKRTLTVPEPCKGRFTHNLQNHKSEHSFYDKILDCRITIKKHIAEVINLRHKQWYCIERPSLELIDKRIDAIKHMLDQECHASLNALMDAYRGESKHNVIRRRDESGLEGDEIIDSIPADLIIHDTVFKKVYAKKTEIKGLAHLKTFLKNRAIDSISPEIAKELAEIRYAMNPLEFAKSFIQSVDDVFLYKDIIHDLSPRDRAKIGLYLFEVQEREQDIHG